LPNASWQAMTDAAGIIKDFLLNPPRFIYGQEKEARILSAKLCKIVNELPFAYTLNKNV
jgi:hypothetical protein